jgi:hypothetical protein
MELQRIELTGVALAAAGAQTEAAGNPQPYGFLSTRRAAQ